MGLDQMKCRRFVSLVISFVVGSSAVVSAAPVDDATVSVDTRVLRLEGDKALVSSDRPASGVLDLRMLRRLVVEPDDLRVIELSLQAEPVVHGLTVVTQGKAKGGDRLDLAELVGDGVTLGEGQELVIAAWRSQWHYHGGAVLRGFEVQRQNPSGQAVALPRFSGELSVDTEAGTFSLVSLSDRDKLPEVDKQAVPVRNGSSMWQIRESSGTRFQQLSDALALRTNGRADFGPSYGWAPALVYRPEQPGQYMLRGAMAIESGQPVDPNSNETVSYLIGIRQAGGRGPVAGAPIQIELRSADGSRLSPRSSLTGADKLFLDVETIRRYLSSLEADSLDVQIALSDAAGVTQATIRTAGDDRVVLKQHAKHGVFNLGPRPRDGVYVTAEGNRLMYGGERLRLWGVAGADDGDAASVRRMARLGINAMRLWHMHGQGYRRPPIFYSDESGPRGELRDLSDGSQESAWVDQYNRFAAELKEAGIFIMAPTLMSSMSDEMLAQEGSFVSGGDDWPAWRQAVLSARDGHKSERLWLAFDERLIKAQKRHITNFLNMVNPYTGRRWADEEAVAIWEFHNEFQLVKLTLEQGFDTWPAYFRDKLRGRWNVWLSERYRSDAALTRAWGELREGESLRDSSVRLAPTLGQRSEYPEARGVDFVQFIAELVGGYYQELEVHARAQGTPGKGVAVIPFSYDTYFRPNIPWHYSTAGHADVANFGMYFWTLTSSLTRDPSLYVMDSSTLADKPTVIYETMSARPNPYRSEYPFLASLFASRHDWDAVFFHWYHTRYGGVGEEYLAMATPMASRDHYWSAVQIERDPVMLSSIALAGQAFLQGSIPPVTDPVVYELGREAIFGYKHYAGPEMTDDAFDRGAVLRFEPEGDFAVRKAGGSSAPYDPRFRFETDKGRLIIDTPTYKAFIGPTVERYRFSDGIVVGGFDTEWVTFAMVSADGKPFLGDDPAEKILINARRDGRNRGLEVDISGVASGGGFINPGELIERTKSNGRAPVIEDPVAFRLWLPFEVEGAFEGYDFATRRVFEQPVNGSSVEHDGRPLYVGRLVIDARGDEADTPAANDVLTPAAQAATRSSGSDGGDVAVAAGAVSGLWSPVAGLAWGMDQTAFDRAARQASWKVERVGVDARLTLFGIDLASLGSAEVRVEMAGGRLVGLRGAYRNPPAIVDLVAAHTKQLGPPTRSNLSENAFDLSEVTWRKQDAGGTLHVTLQSTQGNINLIYRYDGN